MTSSDTAERDWKARALSAEAAVHHALSMAPLRQSGRGTLPIETAEEMAARFRKHIEGRHPALIVRSEHRRTEVFKYADACDCDTEADDYDDDHCESADDGQYICSRSFLGYVCDSCEDEDGDGPAWKPYAVVWPCPPIAALDTSTPAVSS